MRCYALLTWEQCSVTHVSLYILNHFVNEHSYCCCCFVVLSIIEFDSWQCCNTILTQMCTNTHGVCGNTKRHQTCHLSILWTVWRHFIDIFIQKDFTGSYLPAYSAVGHSLLYYLYLVHYPNYYRMSCYLLVMLW